MQLKPQTYYRTRDGRKAFVAFRNPFSNERSAWVWVGFVESKDGLGGRICSWTDRGQVLVDGYHDGLDLIAIWTDRPADEPGYEIVEDGEAIVEAGWEFQYSNSYENFGVLASYSDMIGNPVRECLRDDGSWRWFRRPVPKPNNTNPEPEQWWEWKWQGRWWGGCCESLEEALEHHSDVRPSDAKLFHIREEVIEGDQQ